MVPDLNGLPGRSPGRLSAYDRYVEDEPGEASRSGAPGEGGAEPPEPEEQASRPRNRASVERPETLGRSPAEGLVAGRTGDSSRVVPLDRGEGRDGKKLKPLQPFHSRLEGLRDPRVEFINTPRTKEPCAREGGITAF